MNQPVGAHPRIRSPLAWNCISSSWAKSHMENPGKAYDDISLYVLGHGCDDLPLSSP